MSTQGHWLMCKLKFSKEQELSIAVKLRFISMQEKGCMYLQDPLYQLQVQWYG